MRVSHVPAQPLPLPLPDEPHPTIIHRVKNLIPILPLLLLAIGCQPADDPATVPTEKEPGVPTAAPPSVFESVASHLGKGGVFYSIIDVDGSALRAARFANQFLVLVDEEIPFVDLSEIDIAELLDTLGLTAVTGMGLSSERHEMGFLNRGFLHTPDGRKGLLNIAGGDPRPFLIPTIAPAGADLIFEFDLNPRALFDTLQKLSSQVAGDMGAAGWSGATMVPVFPGAPVSIFDLLTGAPDLRISGFMQGYEWMGLGILEEMDPHAALGDLDFYLRIEGYADLLAELREHLEAEGWTWEESESGYRLSFRDEANPLARARIVGTLPGNVIEFFLNSTTEEKVRSGSPRLADDPGFLRMMQQLGPEGNLLIYQSPEYLRSIVDGVSRDIGDDKTATALITLLERFFGASLVYGTAFTSVNLSDGIAIREISPLSYRSQIVLTPVAYNAALVAAFFGWQQSMQPAHNTYAGLDPAPWSDDLRAEDLVRVNLQILHSLAMEEMIARDRTSIRFDELPESHRAAFIPVAGESYDGLEIHWDGGRLEVTLDDGTVVRLDY